MIRKKILLLGDFSVGKTSLIRRYIDNTFDDRYLTTIGVKIAKKNLHVNGTELELLIWDIEGATAIKQIPKTYYQGASAAIIVCDASRKETITGLNSHIETFRNINPETPYVIAYNKADILTATQRESFVFPYAGYLTSAKEGTNVPQLFTLLAKEIIL